MRNWVGGLAIAIGAATACGAYAAEPLLYALPMVFIDPARGATSDEAARLLSTPEAGGYFKERFKAAYGGGVDQITDATSRRTFVVSMQIPRVSEYVVPKVNGTVERQLAMTGSLYFTNIATGEVLFTYTATAYLSKAYTHGAGQPEAAERALRFDELYHGLVTDLLAKSSAAFKPFEITATAQARFGPLVVLDRGARGGLAVGDALTDPAGDEVKVVFVDADYALAEVQMGRAPQLGAAWSKFSNKTGDVRKAPVIVQVAQNGSGFADDTIQQMFADAAGEKSALSVVPVNYQYAQVVNAVRQQTDISREKTATRRLPRYFLRVTVAPPVTYETPTNLAYKTVRVARARVSGELIDQDGRVQFASFGEDTIRDEVTAGMGYDPRARAEVAVKNAIIDLSRKMGQQLRLGQAYLPVTSAQGAMATVADVAGVLRVGSGVMVLRDLGETPGVKGPVYGPTWSASVAEAGTADAKLKLDLPVFSGAPGARVGDRVRVDSLRPASGRNAARIRPCGTSESLGSRKLPGFDAMAVNQLASGSGYETDMGEFVETVSGALRATGEFETEETVPAAAPAVCVEPVNRIDLGTEHCDEKGVCVSDINLRVTYRIKRDGQIVGREGLETVVHSSAYLKTLAADEKDALIDADVAAATASLLAAIVKTPSFQTGLKGL